jgi:hypothetical protein
MTPVAGAAIPKAALGVVLAPAEEAEETAPESDRLAPDAADRAEDMVDAPIPDMLDMAVALAAEALRPGFPSWADSVATGAAPAPFPEAETAPRAAASPVAASPPPVAVRVGAW